MGKEPKQTKVPVLEQANAAIQYVSVRRQTTRHRAKKVHDAAYIG